ncbi:MAG: inositol monophosphatase family protein [Candidatus Levyibacteriota bacterium]
MSDYKDVLSTILPQAGELIMSYRSHTVTEEKEKNEIVTPADIAANNFLIIELKKAFPTIEIYTEEGKDNKSQTATRWIVDPIDGTTPWVWGNSGFAISIALEKENEIVIGTVYDPVMKELFYAEKGKGAIRNGKAIRPVTNVPIKEMFMVVDWGNKDEKRKEGLAYFEKFFLPEMFARRIVPQFAPALGLCRIAEGRIHALVCNDTWVEDHAAGALILQEAGGYCTNFYQNTSFNHRTTGIIAVNERSTHDALVSFLHL